MRKFLLFAALIVSFIALGRMFDFDPASSRAFLAQHSPLLSSFIFLVLYVVGTFFIWVGPKDVLRVASALVCRDTLSPGPRPKKAPPSDKKGSASP